MAQHRGNARGNTETGVGKWEEVHPHIGNGEGGYDGLVEK